MIDEELTEQLDTVVEAAFYTAPGVAKIYKLLFDCLIKEGFTREESLEIIKSYGMGKQ